MGLLDIFRPRYTLAIGDCVSRKVSYAKRFPLNLSGKAAAGEPRPLCRILRDGGSYFVEALDPDTPVRLDGTRLDPDEILLPGRIYGLSLGGHLIAVRLERKARSLDRGFMRGEWDVASRAEPQDRRALVATEFNRAALLRRFPLPEAYLAFPAEGEACVSLADLIRALPEDPAPDCQASSRTSAPAHEDSGSPPRAAAPARERPRPAEGRPCPCCWKPFTSGEALSIATHDTLTGDPFLGAHAKLRFAPRRFNELGQALDDAGSVCPDLACPHCRGRLPPSYLGHRQLILSLVGAPSSGKSYYLSVLLRLLPETLIRHHHANLQDGDPSGNARLNEMKNRLFSATSPEDAFISKTDFEGVMYERLLRDGKRVSLPRPFVYYLQGRDDVERRAALVFYDNAGEHFKPGVPLDDSPGALHVAASSALLFLFDPTTHPSFRKRLRRKRDPQLRTPATDEQDTILAELAVRVKTLRGLESHERVDTPLAVLVGKLDLWRSLLPADALAVPDDRPLTDEEMERNSLATRELLAELCPTVVANAEALSRSVRYFPVSPLGHSPKEIAEGPLAGKLAPEPRRLRPLLATSPALWALSLVARDLLAPGASPPPPALPSPSLPAL